MSKDNIKTTIGLEVLHYSHDYSGNYVNPSPLVSDFGESNTDLTHWRPEISVARAQAGIMSGKKLLYDFPDGKDNGETVQTFIRSPGLDITEIDSAERRITQIIEDKKESDKRKKEEKDASDKFNSNIQKLADSVSTSDSNDSPSLTNI